MTDLTTASHRLQGIALAVRRKGRGPSILVLHGGGGPVLGFPFADRLAERFELIEPIHPGFAGTPIPDHFDGLEDLVYLYLDLMDALDLKQTVVLGNSLGGWLAAEIAVRTTARIGKLIMVDAVGVKVGGREERDIADLFATSQAELDRLMWHDPARAPDRSKLSDEELKIVVGNRVALSLYGWDPYLHNPQLRHRLHRITVPTLFIWGESDRLVTPAYGKAYCAMIPGAQMSVIARAGHTPYVEQPEAFVASVMSFAGNGE
ncbi:MAG: alpha/beta hydrolase [Hyphomicrobiales bacterium]|nr:alpha/beta hydrolase [Hyphomicrobiales bacterium]